MDKFPPSAQRPALIAFARALKSRENALRRDECGDWRIHGTRGCVSSVPGGFQLYCTGTARSWTLAKEALAFAKVTQDGDQGGCLFLARDQSWPRKTGQVDKWIFCLTTATLAEDQEIR